MGFAMSFITRVSFLFVCFGFEFFRMYLCIDSGVVDCGFGCLDISVVCGVGIVLRIEGFLSFWGVVN